MSNATTSATMTITIAIAIAITISNAMANLPWFQDHCHDERRWSCWNSSRHRQHSSESFDSIIMVRYEIQTKFGHRFSAFVVYSEFLVMLQLEFMLNDRFMLNFQLEHSIQLENKNAGMKESIPAGLRPLLRGFTSTCQCRSDIQDEIQFETHQTLVEPLVDIGWSLSTLRNQTIQLSWNSTWKFKFNLSPTWGFQHRSSRQNLASAGLFGWRPHRCNLPFWCHSSELKNLLDGTRIWQYVFDSLMYSLQCNDAILSFNCKSLIQLRWEVVWQDCQLCQNY